MICVSGKLNLATLSPQTATAETSVTSRARIGMPLKGPARSKTLCRAHTARRPGAQLANEVRCELQNHVPPRALWCQRHTRTESASLRCLVTGDAPFFSSACHLGLDARFGVQDLAHRGEPPVESPALAPPAAGFFFVPRAKPRLGNFVKSCKLLS
jgi:hypothetical protein